MTIIHLRNVLSSLEPGNCQIQNRNTAKIAAREGTQSKTAPYSLIADVSSRISTDAVAVE